MYNDKTTISEAIALLMLGVSVIAFILILTGTILYVKDLLQ